MVEAFQNALLRVCLLALALLVPVLVASSRRLRRPAAALLAAFSRLPLPAKAVASIVFFVCMAIGGAKTNAPPRMLSLAVPQVAQAERKAANWNVRGAWKDSFWLDFEDGWVFPWGTNHLPGVEVVSLGEVWATPFDTNAVASAGAPFEIVPGITSFAFEHTPSNSYRLSWADAAIGRDTNSLVSAAIELFRNGDVAVATNGVAARFPRMLPFPHDGFGQDAEWVSANFTNATEMLAAGYPEWVDAQVGHGLKNGLYKLSVTVPDDPPETAFLTVGDLSVAVTNAGDYVFLLEKGVDYDIGTVPYLENVAYSAVDDILPLLCGSYSWGAGEWTTDGGFGMVPQTPLSFGRVWWMPMFFGSPDAVHIGPDDGPVLFSACFADCVSAPVATYQWTASEGISVASPNSQSTEVYIASMPSWAEAEMSVTATVNGHELNSRLGRLTYGTNDTPQVHLSLSVPEGIACGGARQMLTAAFYSDVETNGCIVLRCVSGLDKIEMWSAMSNGVPVSSSNSWAVAKSHTFTCYLYGREQSDLEGVEFEYEFIPDEGDVQAATAKSTVFECYVQPIDNTHIAGLNVVNPSFLNPQSNAVFRVQVRPVTIPSSKIQWGAISGAATFPSGNTGTEVNVLGSSGMVDLEVRVLGATDERMHFKSKVQ